MTRDEFDKMLEANQIVFVGEAAWRVAHLVAAAEREACAKAAEGYADFQLKLGDDLAQWRAVGALAVMAVIGERGQE